MASSTLEPRGPSMEVGETLVFLGAGLSLSAAEPEPRPVLLSLPLGASSWLSLRTRCFITTLSSSLSHGDAHVSRSCSKAGQHKGR